MKTVCVYHNQDLDGWMSAAIVKHWFKTTTSNFHIKDFSSNLEVTDNAPLLAMLGYNYGQPIPDLSEYDKIIMCDISFPKEVMLRLFDRLDTNFIWIDHHISAITDIIGADYNYLDNVDESTLLNGLRDRFYAACELTWDFFFPDNDKPEVVRLLGLYDSFRHKGTEEERYVLEFQYGARQCISSYEDAYNYLHNCLMQTNGNTIENSIWLNGKSIYQYLCTEAKQDYKNSFAIKLQEKVYDDGSKSAVQFRSFVCVNKNRFNPINFGIDYHKAGYDGAACFHYDGVAKLWRFSLYNDNGEVDCSVIAKQYGGGGHKGASGFVVKDLNLIIQK